MCSWTNVNKLPMEMSPAEQAAWPQQRFSRWHSGISAPLCCISCLRGWEGKGRRRARPAHREGLYPASPRGEHNERCMSLGGGEGKEAKQAVVSHGKLSASCQTPRRSQPALASHSQHTCSCSLSTGEQWWGTQSNARACKGSLGSFLSPRKA